ncbi:MAG: HEPN domain-containing protein [Chloroflexi bacterium]|nr:HEPN domain-containing protein [Chloroflexota bacterium]MBI3340314.1 HEPN domain-containing protein [Chloroflexota bacterium]
MNEYTRKLLDKALDTIESAELLLDHGKTDVAAGRSYYALFYIAESLLNEKGLQFSKHGDVIGAYGKEFSKTKLLDQKFHRWLIEGLDTRLIGDYHVDTKIEMDAVANMINQAREFYEAALRYLEK